jgi:hypothetical protein
MPIHHLHEPVDVFSEWLDDCEAATRGDVAPASANKRGKQDMGKAVHDTSQEYSDDEEEEDDLPAASGLGKKRAAVNDDGGGGDGGKRKKKGGASSAGLDDSDSDDDSL